MNRLENINIFIVGHSHSFLCSRFCFVQLKIAVFFIFGAI